MMIVLGAVGNLFFIAPNSEIEPMLIHPQLGGIETIKTKTK